MIPNPPAVGVHIAGTGCHYPQEKLTNADFERMVDTSDEWIVQRTGIRERRRCDPAKDESAVWLCTEALKKALADAKMQPTDLDMIMLASVTGEMSCPSTACRVAANVGAGTAGAFDLLAACSGFVYATTIAHDHIRMGRARSVAVIGCDVMSSVMDYSDRGVSILFGDAAGAAILRATDDRSKGIIASAMHADGTRWHDLYLPRKQRDFPAGATFSPEKIGHLQMNGREVYKFAVGTFCGLIEETLRKVNLDPQQIDHYICHQSNARMLESARERFGLPHEKMYVNIDRFGNCSAGSVPVCLDELRRLGRCIDGQIVMFVAFGGGLTWSSSLWQL